MSEIFLGSVAIEPNRWGLVDPSGRPSIILGDWLDDIAAAGFDGLELWERHLTDASEGEARRILEHDLPIAVFNTYASFGGGDQGARDVAAQSVARTGATGVKYNVGNSPDDVAQYSQSIAAFAGATPDKVRLLCECHQGISIAEDPFVAARIFEAAGGDARYQAISHLGEDADYLRTKFEVLGPRITHIHVNFLDSGGAPRLADIEDRVVSQIALLRSLGFEGTWTLEFVNGLMSDHDEPGWLMEAAVADLALLREVLDG